MHIFVSRSCVLALHTHTKKTQHITFFYISLHRHHHHDQYVYQNEDIAFAKLRYLDFCKICSYAYGYKVGILKMQFVVPKR